MLTKTCSNPNCPMQNPQPIENFHKDSRKKDGYRSQCKTCQLERARLYRESHRELLAEKQRAYASSGDGQKVASKAWKDAHKEHISEYNAQYHQAHKEERSRYNHDYGQEHHDGVLERSRKRRAISYGLNEHFTEAEFFKKFDDLGQQCFYCHKKLTRETVQRDHYIPLAKGGDNTINNVVPCCKDCNDKKHTMDPVQYIERLGNHDPSRTNGNE